MKRTNVTHEVSEYIPDALQDGVIYVSHRFNVAVHRCCCGCGEEVVTPISPTDWRYDISEQGISLYPSIANWSYACRSHYWIRQDAVVWAGDIGEETIRMGRQLRAQSRETYYRHTHSLRARMLASIRRLWLRLDRRK